MVAGPIRKEINVILNLFDKNFGKKIRKVGNEFQNLNNRINRQTTEIAKQNVQISKAPAEHKKALTRDIAMGRTRDKLNKINTENTRLGNIAQQGYFKTMKMGQPELKKFNEGGRKFTTIGGRMANKFRMASHGLRGFRMEMLGVMFFGMSLMRIFGGLLKTSLEWVGVTELMSVALGILFLPVALMLLDWALLFLKYIEDLTPVQKKWIGYIVLAGLAIGTFLFIFGQFTLGVGSMILAFGALFTPIMLVIAALALIGGYFFLKNHFDKIGIATDSLKNKLIGFGVSGEVFDKVKEKVITWANVLKEKFTGIKTKIGTWIAESLPIVIQGGADILMGLVNGIVANAEKIGKAIRTLIEKISLWIQENGPDILQTGIDILTTIIKGIADNADKVSTAIKEIISAIGRIIDENSEDIIKIGVSIAKGILKGISDFFLSNPGLIIGAIIGGIAGAFIGGPLGAKIGAVVGAGFGYGLQSDLESVKATNERLEKVAKQTNISVDKLREMESPWFAAYPTIEPYTAPTLPTIPIEGYGGTQSVQNITIYPTYDITLNEEDRVKDWINQSNSSMVEEIRRGVRV